MKKIKFYFYFFLILCLSKNGFCQKSEYIKIGDQIWMSKNLGTKVFRNGDSIFFAKNNEEWVKAGNNKQPAWCYPNFNNSKYNRNILYNYFAVQDMRNLAPYGWRVASYFDYNNNRELISFLNRLKGADSNSLFQWWAYINEWDEIDCPSIYAGKGFINNQRFPAIQGFYVLCVKE
jgi:uncharacterized protein (TIGR02145 family)